MNLPPSADAASLIVVGCGDAGATIATAWRAIGGVSWGTTRQTSRAKALQAAGIHGVVTDPGDAVLPRLHGVSDPVAVISTPPDASAAASQIEQQLAWLTSHGVTRIVYLSTSGVYAEDQGGEVTDDSPVRRDDPRHASRLQHESAVLAWAQTAGRRAWTLRLPGIYGPGRTILPRLRDGSYRLVDGGVLWTNRIHLDDIASAALFLLRHGPPSGAVLASDGTPFQIRDLVGWACRSYGFPTPPTVSLDEVPASARPFWLGSKRCRPARLLAWGWTPRVPDVYEGHRASWEAELATEAARLERPT